MKGNWKSLGSRVVGLAIALVALGGGCQKPAPPLTSQAQEALPSDEQLRDRLDKALEFAFANRHLNTKDQAAWQIVHGALVYGRDYKIYHEGTLVPALDYLLAGGVLRGWTMHKGDHGLEAVLEPGSKTGQGHEDQWLGYLSQCGLAPDEKIVVAGQSYTIQDLITQAQWDIYDGMEATWTLMAFSKYLPTDVQWTAKDGTQWNLERIVRMESTQNLDESACGGTHRLYALAVARNQYLASGGKLSDEADNAWRMAQEKILSAVTAAQQYQQPDGSFSTNYFSRPATSAEIDTRISTTGHAFEFLLVALDDKQIVEPWVARAAIHLLGCLEKTQKFDLECGALYHAVHGLDLYRTRRFGAHQWPLPDEPSKPAASESASVQAAP